MELKIISKKEDKSFSRQDILFSVMQSGATLKRSEVHTELCKTLNLNPESTIIVKMAQRFGARESSATAHSYETKELMERYEPNYLLDRVAGKKKAHAQKSKSAPKKEEK